MQKRSLHELIDTEDPAWPLVQQGIKTARNQVEVLTPNRTRATEVLLHLQVTTHSFLGAVAFETGGMFIDHGWVRVLGSGHERMRHDLLSWNVGQPLSEHHPLKDAFLVAYDVVGGFFALNGGAFDGEPGEVFYFGPDTLSWQGLGGSYSHFLTWALTGDLGAFYQHMRWPGWEDEVSLLAGDQALSIFPFLFTERGMPVSERSRRIVPILELWRLHLEV